MRASRRARGNVLVATTYEVGVECPAQRDGDRERRALRAEPAAPLARARGGAVPGELLHPDDR